MTGKEVYDALMHAYAQAGKDPQDHPWGAGKPYGPPQLLTGNCVAWPFLSETERRAFIKAADALAAGEGL